jgi:CRISPR-associated protein Cpf1
MKLTDFTNLYSLSKTLRFELIPQGKTLKHIQEKGLIEQDKHRADSYKRLKKIIDEYHKSFIDQSLRGIELKDLISYESIYLKKDKEDQDKKNFERVKLSLRKQISDAFKGQEKFKTLFSKELIKEDLLNFVKGEDKELLNEFRDFTTYFTGFHENRKNMYVADEKATAIGFRLINENLPKFIDNLTIFNRIQNDESKLTEEFKTVLIEMEDMIQGIELLELFSLSYFNETLSQRGIELYNTIIGGRTSEEGKNKTKGLNEIINLHNQQQNDKRKRLPKFKQLYKQILSDRNATSFVIDHFENDSELLESIEQFYQSGICNYESDGNTINLLTALQNFLSSLNTFDLSRIYLKNDRSITDISQSIFGDWNVIKSALADYYLIAYPLGKNEKPEKFEERKEKWISKTSYFDINTIQTALQQYDNENLSEKIKANDINDYFVSMGLDSESKLNLVNKINKNYDNIKDLLNSPYPADENLKNDKKNVARIKEFLDSLMDILHFIKPLNVKEDGLEKDESFYSIFEPLYDQLTKTISLYNKVRNYLTSKPYSIEKIKLNFENSTLLDGWDVNKEADNSCVIFRKKGLFYLGVMDKKNNRIFERDVPECEELDTAFEKINYKLLPGANKMLPKVFLSKKGVTNFNPTVEILENYKNETHKKGDSFNVSHMRTLINYFKESISLHPDWKEFGHQFSDTESYEDLSGFYREVEHQGYKVTYKNIDTSYVEKLVEEGKLYLFKIYNKDFSPYSKGTPNMHTLYWRMLFDEDNLANTVYKLNGEAEIFFRKSSINQKNRIIHKAGEPIKSKNDLNTKRESTFNYDIVKDKRFTLDKFQFHVPITMNFKATGSENINENVKRYLQNNPEVKIIGLDRGERHLIYLTLINQKGELLKQESLNLISNYKQQVNYKELLQKKEGDRTQSRKDWNTIENIKEIKEGYLSQVVHKIATMMVEENAIVVMEDLNQGFMRGRQKVERQVYQKLEKMLIDKLNYLVFKSNNPTEPAGLLKALQLTSKFDTFKNMGKQSGFLFYVPAWNTSKIDPATGFVDFLKPKYENIEKAKSFFRNFQSIKFNNHNNYFEFRFDYNDFTTKAEGTKTEWAVCTYGKERYVWNSKLNLGKGAMKEIDVTQFLQLLFHETGIAYAKGENLIQEILDQQGADFYKKLMRLLAITLSLRHTNGESGSKEKDFILSPVCNDEGIFFNSQNGDEKMPRDADANGAYHIALKGLWALKQIDKADDLKKIKLAISNKEWLQFVQQKQYKL